MNRDVVARKRKRLDARATAYRVAAAHLRLVESPSELEVDEMNRLALKLDHAAEKVLKQKPPRCRLLPYNQWCDHGGLGDFMGHTCEGPRV